MSTTLMNSLLQFAVAYGVHGRSISIDTYVYVVENEHYSTVSGLIQLVISLECFIEITPDFVSLYECISYWQSLVIAV